MRNKLTESRLYWADFVDPCSGTSLSSLFGRLTLCFWLSKYKIIKPFIFNVNYRLIALLITECFFLCSVIVVFVFSCFFSAFCVLLLACCCIVQFRLAFRFEISIWNFDFPTCLVSPPGNPACSQAGASVYTEVDGMQMLLRYKIEVCVCWFGYCFCFRLCLCPV